MNIENTELKTAVVELLYQLADDDYLYSYRGSEWLGLAPHIEEDVAFSSITQDTMGHATLYYNLLQDIGEGDADVLAHLRPKEERRNSVLVERQNGEGYYKETPIYDWGYAVVRNYIYTTAKKVKIDSLKNSSYEPLARVAVKMSAELYYHLVHWKTWFVQLCTATDDARTRMAAAIEEVFKDVGDLFSLGEMATSITGFDLIDSEEVLQEKWVALIAPTLEAAEVTLPTLPNPKLNGRKGQHTEELSSAIETMSEVYRSDLTATW